MPMNQKGLWHTHFLKFIICEALQIGTQVFWCEFRWKIFKKEVKLDSISGNQYLLICYSQFNKEKPIFVHFSAALTAGLASVCRRPIWFDLFPVEWTIMNYNGSQTTLKKFLLWNLKVIRCNIKDISYMGWKILGKASLSVQGTAQGDINQHESKHHVKKQESKWTNTKIFMHLFKSHWLQ